jgi:hypothetical protein
LIEKDSRDILPAIIKEITKQHKAILFNGYQIKGLSKQIQIIERSFAISPDP